MGWRVEVGRIRRERGHVFAVWKDLDLVLVAIRILRLRGQQIERLANVEQGREAVSIGEQNLRRAVGLIAGGKDRGKLENLFVTHRGADMPVLTSRTLSSIEGLCRGAAA